MRTRRSEVRSRRPVKPAPRRGFSLIELMVVIGIILLLMGLIVSVTVALTSQSEARATQNTLKLLDQALHEWETTAERSFTWGKNNQPVGTTYDIQRDASAEDQTSVVLWRLKNTPGCKEILAKIDSDMLVNDTSVTPPRLKLLDAWGKEIVVVHPGRLPVFTLDGANPLMDADGTIRVTPAWSPDINENRVGVCASRRICFISAGADGKFGDLHLDKAEVALSAGDVKDVQQAGDNMSSYPLLKVRP